MKPGIFSIILGGLGIFLLVYLNFFLQLPVMPGIILTLLPGIAGVLIGFYSFNINQRVAIRGIMVSLIAILLSAIVF